MIDLVKKLMGAVSGSEKEPSPGTGESLPPGTGQRRAGRDVHLAACAVFLEMAQIDNEFDERERELILDVFQHEYGLSAEDVVDLKRASTEALSKSMDHWQFTNVINQHYSNEEKLRLVELLWQLVYADGKMDEHENYFIHKLAKLLRLTHRELINAKLQVLHGRSGPEQE
jgi:uncharacterized tellurite resistance protein B-like protein